MRSVVLKPVWRCDGCQLPERWCICPAKQDIQSVLQVSLLTHQREHTRSSSTGNLIHRVFANSQQHIWHTDKPPAAIDVINPDKELWLLHPNGQALPKQADPAAVQVVLLDGSWTETGLIARTANSWGRLVSLPITGESRFWLREKQAGGRYSTAEALLFLLDTLGLTAEHEALRIQFELHVYAHLRARGRKEFAAEFLVQSLIRTALADFLQVMHEPRPLDFKHR